MARHLAAVEWLRRIILFVCGVLLVIAGLTDTAVQTIAVVVGLVLVGIIPLDDVTSAIRRAREHDG